MVVLWTNPGPWGGAGMSLDIQWGELLGCAVSVVCRTGIPGNSLRTGPSCSEEVHSEVENFLVSL